MSRTLFRALLLPLCLASFGLHAALAPFENVRGFYRSITHDGQSRPVLYLAPRQTPSQDVPLLVLLHYVDGESEPMANLTAPGFLVREFGVYAIVPQAINGEWSHNPLELGVPDDMGFLTRLIDDAIAQYPIDPRRVYMVGYSDGGNMAARFACQRPEKIAAVAIVAATMRKTLSRLCAPRLPTPMLLMNGTSDRYVTYDGSSTPYVNPLLMNTNLSAPDNAARWARTNGCLPNPVTTDLPNTIRDSTTVRLQRYANCTSGGVDFYTIAGGGHTWPGSLDVLPQLGLTTQDFSATPTIWNFLRQFSRP
ncbi:MAG: alpha/beta hydrolase family esterase [Panacagrimonas sp.]